MFNNDKELEKALKQCTEEARDSGHSVEEREKWRMIAQWLLELMILRNKVRELE